MITSQNHFQPKNISLRIEAILRRTQSVKISSILGKQESFKIGIFSFDYNALLLKSPSISRNLTRKEADLFRLLCMHKNTLIPREIIFEIGMGRR